MRFMALHFSLVSSVLFGVFVPQSPQTATGFIFQPLSIKKGLVQVTDAQKTLPLSVSLDIGNTILTDPQLTGGSDSSTTDNQASRMSIQGMVLEISAQLAEYVHPKMPGAHGPHPQLSSGVRTLRVLQDGSFVSMMGRQVVQALNGCWELVWREQATSGAFICGFDIPEEYVRNDASIPSGRLYMSFPIWTKDGLAQAMQHKERITQRIKELLSEKEQHLAKMQETNNLFAKAMHYKNAAEAVEKFSLQPTRGLEVIPASDDEVIHLQDDLILANRGYIFRKDGSGNFARQHAHTLMGTAWIRPYIDPNKSTNESGKSRRHLSKLMP